MAEESRVKKSLLNARVNLIFYFLTLILSFFSRKIFLDCLGADFVGLTTTLQNLLGFLNLAELGIGSAIGYVLYKPLFEHDQQKINEIISVFGYLYRWIGLIILGAGLILGGFLPLIFPSTSFDMGIIYFAYLSFLASSLIGYFANYKQTLLGADQKNYVVTAYFQTASIVKTLIQMASAYYTGSYYLWVIIELTFGIVYSIILNWKIRQVYPWLKSEVRQGKQLFRKYPEVMRYTKQLFVHKIGDFAQYQATPFLTYAFVSLKTVAYYGNYSIIIDKLIIFLGDILNSTRAGVGNLIAEGNIIKVKRVFWELISIRFLAATVFTTTTYLSIQPFIKLWIGEEYLLPSTIVILILSRLFLTLATGATNQFLYGFGLFYDTWAPLAQTTIYFIFAIIGGYLWGLAGILASSVLSLIIIIGIWKPYFLFKKGFKESVLLYWIKWGANFVICVISFFITRLLINIIYDSDFADTNLSSWLVFTITTVAISTAVCYIILLSTKGMRDFTQRIASYIKGIYLKLKH